MGENIMKTITKLLAVFVILGMLVGFFPTNVRAEDNTPTESGYTENYEDTDKLTSAEKAAQEAAARAAELAKILQDELDNSTNIFNKYKI